MNHASLKHTLMVSFALLLGACGGGSGGSFPAGDDNHSAGGVTTTPELTQALTRGDATLVSAEALRDAALATIASQRSAYQAVKAQLLQLNTDGTARRDGSSLTAVHWDVTHDSAKLSPQFGYNDSLLISNASHSSTAGSASFAIVGEQQKGERYLVMGSNPMRTAQRFPASVNAQMDQLLENGIGWLAGRSDFSVTPLKVVIAQMDQSYYFPDRNATRSWLDAHYQSSVSYNDAASCDGAALAGCLNADTDILMISQVGGSTELNPQILAAVKAAQARGTGVLYMHYDGGITELGSTLLNHFNVSFNGDNYWNKYYMNAQDMRPYFNQLPEYIADIQQMLSTLAAPITFDFNQCDGEDCSTVNGFNQNFMNGATRVRNIMADLDREKRNIFASSSANSNEYRLEKLLALLGDRYRQQVVFPMSRDTADATAFVHSVYADMSVYNYRSLNPVQADMGNFSRSDFSHITPVSKTINLVSKNYFRAAGVYVLPGKTVRITRLDNSPVNTKVAVNTQRSASTHWFATNNGYNRPKYLQSTQIPLASGETVEFTSPYGGPLQIFFDANDQNVRFNVENIGLHPYWNGTEDNADFEARLSAGDFDWAELSTAGFEVHSQLEKMRNSMNGWGGTAADMALATERYVSNLPHVLAGFEGPGIDVVAEMHDFASTNNFTVQNIDIVKHMNADQPTCGWGCSGNPYDAGWSFSPTGHGDIHELGHGLEKGKFRFAGWEGHASTNFYSYHSKYHYYLDTGKDPQCQSLPFESLFNTLQTSRNQADPVAYMQEQALNGWSNGAAVYIQMMMAAQAQGALTDGWMLLPRLHILEREFWTATRNDDNWAAKKAALGFASFNRSDASALSNNDWLNIALSKVTGLDMRDYLTMWGFPAGAAANAQVAALALPAMSKTFYASGGAEFCKGLDKTPVAIDGAAAWPL